MDDFGLLAKDFGLRPQGKSAPMSASRPAPKSSRSGWSSPDSLHDYADVFGGPPKPATATASTASTASVPSFDSIFHGFSDSKPSAPPFNPSMPVYDKPVYDDDIFDGVPGVRSSTGNMFDDVFASSAPASRSNRASSPPIEDLLESLGRAQLKAEAKGPGPERSGGGGGPRVEDLGAFEELIPGFGRGSPPKKRETSGTSRKQSHVPLTKSTMNAPEDPFVVLETTSTSTYSSSGLYTDPLEHISMPVNSESTKVNTSSVSEGVFDDTDAFDRPRKSVPLSTTSEKDDKQGERNPLRNVQTMSPGRSGGKEPPLKSSIDPFEHLKPKVRTSDNHFESNDVLFEKPSKASNSSTSFSRGGVQNFDTNATINERDATSDRSSRSDEADDVWLTVAEIPLFTQPTIAPPPSRAPPPLVIKQTPTGMADHGASVGLDAKRNNSESFWQSSQSFSERLSDPVKKSGVSPIDELENFAMSKPQDYANEHADIFSTEDEIETNSAAAASAAAMKEAMDRAEAKFRQAREVRERERDAKSAKLRESAQQDGEEKEVPDFQAQEDREKQERLDRERRQREREEKEKEEKRRERERELELEREREKARQAVERATREARERAAAEARLKAERAAVGKANAEARQRAERAAVQRAAAEARERAAAEAREKAERAAAEARERAAAEAHERAAAEGRERAVAEAREKAAVEARERAAVERAAAEARLRAERAAVERAAAEARERAAAAAREKQYKNENDLESFFGMGARANSAPRQRTTTSETIFDVQNKAGSDGIRRTSVGSSSTFRKASSTTNIVDDLTTIFGATPSSGEFPEVEGESEERRRARLERHQRTLERAAKALAEKNERDIQVQREQAERHRIAETLDIEIKRWAAGKEGNLRALLSTLQYVLWPECGWHPVSLTDLITSASVKKVYRKATLCIHPDKVQQKGANLQQKYIAEKVFDLLKEAWNKFNSEELF